MSTPTDRQLLDQIERYQNELVNKHAELVFRMGGMPLDELSPEVVILTHAVGSITSALVAQKILIERLVKKS